MTNKYSKFNSSSLGETELAEQLAYAMEEGLTKSEAVTLDDGLDDNVAEALKLFEDLNLKKGAETLLKIKKSAQNAPDPDFADSLLGKIEDTVNMYKGGKLLNTDALDKIAELISLYISETSTLML